MSSSFQLEARAAVEESQPELVGAPVPHSMLNDKCCSWLDSDSVVGQYVVRLGPYKVVGVRTREVVEWEEGKRMRNMTSYGDHEWCCDLMQNQIEISTARSDTLEVSLM